MPNGPNEEPRELGAGGPVLSRRVFLTATGKTGVAAAIVGTDSVSTAAGAPPAGPDDANVDGAVGVTLRVNGKEHRLRVDPRTTLLDTLRERLGMTGSKKGCDQGQCGACTVHIDGRRTLSCLTLAVATQGKAVTTIEGLEGADGALHPMQQAFLDCDAFQCGYCTPGQIMSAVAMVNEGHAKTDAEIREHMSGNLCRCAAYPNIVDAVNQAKTKMRSS